MYITSVKKFWLTILCTYTKRKTKYNKGATRTENCLVASHSTMLIAEVAGVTFSDSNSVPVSKFWNPGPVMFQIWEFDSCSDSGYNHQSNLNLPMFSLTKWPHRLLLLPKLKSNSGSRPVFFSNIWLRVRKKNAESCRSRLRYSGSGPTSGW